MLDTDRYAVAALWLYPALVLTAPAAIVVEYGPPVLTTVPVTDVMVTVHPPDGMTTPLLKVTILVEVDAVIVPVQVPLLTVPVTMEILVGVETVKLALVEIELLFELPRIIDQVVVPPDAMLVAPKD